MAERVTIALTVTTVQQSQINRTCRAVREYILRVKPFFFFFFAFVGNVQSDRIFFRLLPTTGSLVQRQVRGLLLVFHRTQGNSGQICNYFQVVFVLKPRRVVFFFSSDNIARFQRSYETRQTGKQRRASRAK